MRRFERRGEGSGGLAAANSRSWDGVHCRILAPQRPMQSSQQDRGREREKLQGWFQGGIQTCSHRAEGSAKGLSGVQPPMAQQRTAKTHRTPHTVGPGCLDQKLGDSRRKLHPKHTQTHTLISDTPTHSALQQTHIQTLKTDRNTHLGLNIPQPSRKIQDIGEHSLFGNPAKTLYLSV